MLARAYSVKIGTIFGVRFQRRKVHKKQTYMKTETCKLCSRDCWIFLPNANKINHCYSELYRFKVVAFFKDTVYVSYVFGNNDGGLTVSERQVIVWMTLNWLMWMRKYSGVPPHFPVTSSRP